MLDLTTARPCLADPPDAPARPRVTVLTAVYNGGTLIEQSVNSILSQTFQDFELIVVDDCSTDGTEQRLRQFRDPRLRLICNSRNVGAVAARNIGFGAARGCYIAPLDHDDISRPTRLAEQVDYLDAHAGTVLVGTAGHVLEDGTLRPFSQPARTDPILIRWLLWVKNPLVFSSTMFRADAVRGLGHFLRADAEHAEDYALYIDLLDQGAIARLDRALTVYRLHAANNTRIRLGVVIEKTASVLHGLYAPWLGAEAGEAAALIARHVAAGIAAPDEATLSRLGRHLHRVADAFITAHHLVTPEAERIRAQAGRLWWATVRAAVRGNGGIRGPRMLRAWRHGPAPGDEPVPPRLPMRDAALSVMRALLPAGHVLQTVRRVAWPRQLPEVPLPSPAQIDGAVFSPVAVDPHRPPTLHVVVDTEAEFDWSQPFAHGLTRVTAMAAQDAAQDILESHGVRPVYLVDYPVASQEEGYAPLRRYLARDACRIGAHLHPWTNPPLDETPSDRNSYPGNLPPALEAVKLDRLLAAIRENLGVEPVFYKAGRYGIGPATAAALAERGIPVDFSILPGADLRPLHGPDFRAFSTSLYRAAGGAVLSVPMTRGAIGPLARLLPVTPDRLNRLLSNPAARAVRLRGLLSTVGLFEVVTLTPEGVTGDRQISLLRTMRGQGHRIFVLHYHSPSLVPGHTPYVRTADERDVFLSRLREVCRVFFDEWGGLAGDPQDFLPARRRGLTPGHSKLGMSAISM